MADDDIIAGALKRAFNRDPWAVPGKDDKPAGPARSELPWEKLLSTACPSCGDGYLKFKAPLTARMANTGEYPLACYSRSAFSSNGPRGCDYEVLPKKKEDAT
jgi:hypothetical protein